MNTYQLEFTTIIDMWKLYYYYYYQLELAKKQMRNDLKVYNNSGPSFSKLSFSNTTWVDLNTTRVDLEHLWAI